MLLREMVFDGRFPNMRVDPDWYEGKHPQEMLPKVEDPVALYRPAPEVVRSPSSPVLTVVVTGGGPSSVTFTLLAGFNSHGPFLVPDTTYGGGYGSPTAPSGSGTGVITPDPVLVNGRPITVVSVVTNLGARYIMLMLPGVVPQSFFVNLLVQDSGGNSYNLSSASALFNGTFSDPAFSTWVWPQVPLFGLANSTPFTVNW